MTEHDPVCVLIATLATRERAPYVHRALASLRVQAPVRARPVVIVNGSQCDRDLVRSLELAPDVQLLQLEEASLPDALAEGRRRVDTALFAQLDDDDELLPGALAIRARRIQQPDCPDAVITNCIIRENGTDTLSIPDIAEVVRNPLHALMDRNWLLPGAVLFRTAAVTPEVFTATPRFLEWTYIALVLATRHRIVFLSDATVVHYAGLPFSVDQSRECSLGRPRAFGPVLALDLPAFVRRRLKTKRGAAWHAAADLHRAAGTWRTAWAAHLRSIGSPGGWRYLAYTRRLVPGMGS